MCRPYSKLHEQETYENNINYSKLNAMLNYTKSDIQQNMLKIEKQLNYMFWISQNNTDNEMSHRIYNFS